MAMAAEPLLKLPANPLRIWRRLAHVTQGRVAVRLGVSNKTIQNWENGSITPRAEHVERIARLMGTNPEDLRRAWSRWLRRAGEA